MPRPCKIKNIEKEIQFTCFKPAGIPREKLEKVELAPEELEAIRLTNLHGLSQDMASKKMGISASTLNRLLKSANKKVADALVNGKWIRIYKQDGSWKCD